MNQPAAIRRPLTDPERELLADLTVWSIQEDIARKHGIDVDRGSVIDALKDLTDKSGLQIAGDDHHVCVRTTQHGHVLVHCARDWLAYWAHCDDPLTSAELRRALHPDDRGTP